MNNVICLFDVVVLEVSGSVGIGYWSLAIGVWWLNIEDGGMLDVDVDVGWLGS